MYKIFLIIFIFKSVLADDDSPEKYIDLLPEEEKQEFLNRIARRILEEIKSGNLPEQSQVEITDDQLNAHDAYIQDILKEETERLKDQKEGYGSERNEKPDEDNIDEDKYIDLTLREGKRLKRKNGDQNIEMEITTEFAYNVIPVQTVHGGVKNDQIKQIVDSTNKDSEDENQLTTIKYEVNNLNYQSESKNELLSINKDLTNNFSNSTENDNNLRKSLKKDISETATFSDLDHNSVVTQDYILNSETSIPSFENVSNIASDINVEIPELNNNTNDNLDTEINTDFDVEVNTDFPTTVIISSTPTILQIQHSSLYKELDLSEFKTTTLTTNDDKSATATVSDLEKNNQKFQTSGADFNENVINTTINNNDDSTTENSNPLSSISVDTLKANISDNETEFSEITTSENKIDDTSSSPNLTLIRKSEDVKSVEENKTIGRIIEPKVGLRSRSDAEESTDEGVSIKVYEIDPQESPFKLFHDVKPKEQPHYAPIYNYAPENAYFRPYDRFQPYIEDAEPDNLENDRYFAGENILMRKDNEFDQYIKPNIRSRFFGYNNKEMTQFKKFNYPIKKGYPRIYGFMKPVQTNLMNQNKYNSYDYFDMDYDSRNDGRYILRKSKIFPDSNEDDHPFHSIHKSDSVKDHVRAVRKLLYLQKIFGYVPDTNEKVRKFNQYAKPSRFVNKKTNDKLKKPINDGIAEDYYFERVNSEEEVGKPKATRGDISKYKTLDNRAHDELNKKFESNTNSQNHDMDQLKDIIVDKNEFSSFFDTMLGVLEDIIRFNNTALELYDWLGTSVDIQSAIKKLLALSEGLQYGEEIHPKDLELLKYSLYLFKSAKVNLDDQRNKTDIKVKRRKQKKRLLPKNRNRTKVKQSLIQWKNFAKYIRNVDDKKLAVFYDFEDFLQKILFQLNELHDAIKHISMITKFEDQNWFSDLKEIFLKKAGRKQFGGVILHLSVVNLLNHVEEDAINGVEVNFRNFVKNNLEAVRRTKNEFVFVLRVLDELNRINV